MSHQIKVASRTGIKMLAGFYGESGCGKTYSALLFARGLVGPKGKIVMIDTESGRGSLYADDALVGGYEVLEMDAPFSPQNYIDAIDACDDHKADAVIIDSMSHEWEGIGGVLEMAAEIEARNGKSLNNWNKPKMEHAKLLGRILRTRSHMICCIRAKYKTRNKTDKQTGKKTVERDDVTSPIQSEEFIYEMIVNAEILPSHAAFITKTHKDLVSILPKGIDQPFAIEHGAAVAKWCVGGKAAPVSTAQKSGATEEQRERMLGQLCDKHGPDAVQEYAIAKGIIQPGQNLDDWPLVHVVTTKAEFTALDGKIDVWRNQ